MIIPYREIPIAAFLYGILKIHPHQMHLIPCLSSQSIYSGPILSEEVLPCLRRKEGSHPQRGASWLCTPAACEAVAPASAATL